MQKGFGLIDEDDTRVTSHYLSDYACECLDTITCLVNELCSRMESNSTLMNPPLLHIVVGWSIRQADS